MVASLARTLPAMTSQEPSGRAIASLICGILGLAQVLPCIGPILAVVLGADERSGVGRAGYILGWIGLVLTVAVVVIGLLFLMVTAAFAAFG